jgi:hypothetical protein
MREAALQDQPAIVQLTFESAGSILPVLETVVLSVSGAACGIAQLPAILPLIV